MANRVVNFHDVYDRIWFESTLSILKKKYKIVSVKDIEDYFYAGKKLKNTCHITVDDGDRTFYDIIYPVLKKFNIPATLFVSPKACLKQENFWFQEIAGFDAEELKLTIAEYLALKSKALGSYSVYNILKNLNIGAIWDIINKYKKSKNIVNLKCQNINIDQLREIDREGLVTIGAHTLNHPVLANEEDEDSKIEIGNSIEQLQVILGHKILYFAYPNGIQDLDFGQREIDVLKEKGCLLSFTTELAHYSRKNNIYAIPRLAFSFGNSFFVKSKLLLGPYWESLKNLKGISEKRQRLELKTILSQRG